MRNNKWTLASVFFTFFIDNFSWAIVFPIFAPYFLAEHSTLFSADVSMATRTMLLGFFLMAFSLGQFIGAPLLGEYADRRGRKKALATSTLLSLAGLALSAWSVQEHNLWLLFVGRLMTGVFAGNMSICVACISDLSPDEKSRGKRFGHLSLTAGISFVLGAFIGGKLADSSLSSWFSFALPLWLASGLTAINFVFVLLAKFETTHKHEAHPFSLFESVRKLRNALRSKRLGRLYAVYFLFLFAWVILFQFTPVLLVDRFDFTSSNISDAVLFMGCFWGMGSTVLNHWLLNRFSTLRILEVSLIGFTALSTTLIFLDHVYSALIAIAGCTLIGGLAWPLCNNVISSEAPREAQGKVLGMSQSIQSLAMALAPAVGGVAYQGLAGLPFLLGAFSSLCAGLVYFRLKRP